MDNMNKIYLAHEHKHRYIQSDHLGYLAADLFFTIVEYHVK